MSKLFDFQKLREAARRVWPTPYAGDPVTEPWPAEGPGRDAVVMIDASSTMRSHDWPPTRFQAALDATYAYVNRLASEEPGARVAVVAYSTNARLACHLLPVSQQGVLFQCVEGLRAGGYTNIGAALELALQVLSAGRVAMQAILLSDGHNNVGGNPLPIAADLRQRAIVECVGIGGKRTDVQEDLMMEVASAYPDGTKRYRWIGDGTELLQHFHALAGRISRS